MATAVATNTDRHFSGNYNDFLNKDLAWFKNNSPKKMMSNLREATPRVMQYFGSKPKVRVFCRIVLYQDSFKSLRSIDSNVFQLIFARQTGA